MAWSSCSSFWSSSEKLRTFLAWNDSYHRMYISDLYMNGSKFTHTLALSRYGILINIYILSLLNTLYVYVLLYQKKKTINHK